MQTAHWWISQRPSLLLLLPGSTPHHRPLPILESLVQGLELLCQGYRHGYHIWKETNRSRRRLRPNTKDVEEPAAQNFPCSVLNRPIVQYRK